MSTFGLAIKEYVYCCTPALETLDVIALDRLAAATMRHRVVLRPVLEDGFSQPSTLVYGA